MYNVVSRKAFWDNCEEIDVALYADALVAIFRFMPEEDSIPIFMECIEPERSEAVKACVIRATLTLINEVRFSPSYGFGKASNQSFFRQATLHPRNPSIAFETPSLVGSGTC